MISKDWLVDSGYVTTLFICLSYTVLNDKLVVGYALDRTWKVAVMAYFKMQSQSLTEGTEEDREKHHSVYRTSGSGFEYAATRRNIANYTTDTFDDN